ncbi:hypothetical protein ABZ342_05080 [Amycolatopsis sp. NPDC005961]|uniref:hypothetical protein n=1 Tax=Amycolatopsis sp. NPDC005961 TaxID=3156720 RepID=UPI0012D7CEB2|nr:hypothetical protein [Amycolatopsis camponoti]
MVACGDGAAGFEEVDDVESIRVPSRPGKAEIDPLLGEHDHLVVSGTDADLAAVVVRLLRKDALTGVSVGFVPSSPDSAVAALWDLPKTPLQALALALRGEVDPVPLIRDDVGGVLVGRGVLRLVRGVAYADEQVALRGPASSVEVTPDSGGPGLAVRVVKGTIFKRPTTFYSRAFQIGCIPTRPVSDDVVHDRALNKWTWYRHTEDLRLVRGTL